MAANFKSIFRRNDSPMPQGVAKRTGLQVALRPKPLMRVLEPRVLLDAAAIETAVEVAEQAAHSQLADDYLANMRSTADLKVTAPVGEETSLAMAEMQDDLPDLAEIDARRTDREIVFVDAGIENRDELIASLEPGVTIHVLDAGSDGIEQMAAVLSGPHRYDAIHIFSHGNVGELYLGNTSLTTQTIAGQHADALQIIGAALVDEGDILLYGCNFGEGSEGVEAANLLAAATGADIAASDDLTGSESLAGDWDLEVSSGLIETRNFSIGGWDGVLGDYQLEAVSAPDVSHITNGVIGTAGTEARYTNAVTYDPGAGPIEQYDLVGTIVAIQGSGTANFSLAPSGGDFRVSVTNTGAIESMVGGQNVLEDVSVTVVWRIVITGTSFSPIGRSVDIAFDDINGVAGTPDTVETVGIGTQNLTNYTLENPTDLVVTSSDGTLFASGTSVAGGKIGAQWDTTNQLAITYSSRTSNTTFDLDGNGDITFSAPVVTPTVSIDLDSSNTANNNFSTTYLNGGGTGPVIDVPVSIADSDIAIADIDSEFIQGATIVLTNASAGDSLNVDTTFLASLGSTGISAVVDTGVPGLITVTLSDEALASDYEAAIQSITYSNGNPDGPTFNQGPRIITTTVTDGVTTSAAAQTTITIVPAGGTPSAQPDFIVTNEDTAVSRPVGTGLLANDEDPQGTTLNITSATFSNGSSLTIGAAANPTPQGGTLVLAANGSFTYTPGANFSGNEVVTYTVSDGANTSTSFVTFVVKPIVDTPTITVTQADPTSDEDDPSNLIDIAAVSPDPSETQEVYAEGIPVGVIITDGTNSFESTLGDEDAEITNWDLTQIRVLPVQNSDLDISFDIVVYNYEVDFEEMTAVETVTFQIDAVADEANLIVTSVDAPIDATVDLSTNINVSLFDTDGSEEISFLTISNIPAGGDILVSGVPLVQTAGSVTLSVADLANLSFQPPITGTAVIYTMQVFATTTEIAPENGVTQATAVRGPVDLVIDLNNNDDPVFPTNDTATTSTGSSVAIDVLANDFIPDGGGQVVAVNGQPIFFGVPLALPNGVGTVELDFQGRVLYQASGTFSGVFTFVYTVQDIDLSQADATVTVTVEPRWGVTGAATVAEGGVARFDVGLEGTVRQGETVSVDISAVDIGTTAADYGSLDTAILNSITNLGQTDFSYAAGTLTYTAPEQNYTSDYQPTGSGFTDISLGGTPLGLGDDGTFELVLGFDVDFYAQDFSSLFISANGAITFGAPSAASANGPLDGSAFGGIPGIAAFWDDLDSTGGEVYTRVNGVPGSRTILVQWDQVSLGGGPNRGSFQVEISEASGDITIHYADVDFGGAGTNGATATIGLQGPSAIHDQFSINTASIVSGSSITFTPGASTNPLFLLDLPIVDDPTFEPQEAFRIQLATPVNAGIGAGSATTTIDVSDNTPPVAADDAVLTTESTVGVINVITNGPGLDTDPDGSPLSLTEINGSAVTDGQMVTLGSGAQVTVNLDGTVSYDPNGAFDSLQPSDTGLDSFTYTITDGFGGTDTATVNVSITGENTTPVLDLDDDGTTPGRDFAITYPELSPPVQVVGATASVLDADDTSFVSLVMTLSNFIQPGDEVLRFANTDDVVIGVGGPFTITLAGAPTIDLNYNGTDTITLTRNGGGEIARTDLETVLQSVTYRNTSGADLPGIRTVDMVVNDGDINSPASRSAITVSGVNQPPDAQDDGTPVAFVVNEDDTLTILESTLLANDSDPNFDPVTVISVQGAVNGIVSRDGFGSIFFTPTPDYAGPASFTYTIGDGQGEFDTATVFIDVTNINDLPVVDLNGATGGIDHSFTYTENDALTPIVTADAIVSDVDDASLVDLVITMTNGQIGDILDTGTLPPGVSASVIPPAAGTGLTAPGSVTITLTGAGTPTDFQTALRGIRFSNNSETPNETARTIEVVARDAAGSSTLATTTIAVTAVNDVPVANNDGVYVPAEDTARVFTPPELLGNDTDADGDTLVIQSVQGAVNGTVSINGGGNVVFTPATDYTGPASFTYTVSDGNGGTDTATVSLSVAAVNDAPVVDLDTGVVGTGYTATYTEDSTGIPVVDASISVTDVDDTNVESATITLTNGQIGDVLEVGTLPGGISASVVPSGPLGAAGTVTVTLSGSATLADYETALQLVTFRSASQSPDTTNRTVAVALNDGNINSSTATTTIAVLSVNDVPVAVNDGVFVPAEDTARVFTPAELLGNDTDADGDTLVIQSVQGAVNGTVSINGGGNVVFTPTANYNGPASFTYTVSDGNGGTDTATVSLSVAAVNDPPTVDLNGAGAGTDYAATYTENGAGIPVTAAAVDIVDVDSANLTSASVTLTNGRIGDILEVGTLPGGITASISPPTALIVDGPVTVTLTGPATLANFEAALQLVTFRSVSETPDTSDRTLLVVVSDGTANSTPVTSTITVIEVNDAPVAGDDGPFAMTEDVTRTFTPVELLGNDTDADGDTLVIQSVQGAVGGSVVINGAGDVVFTPAPGVSGPASFTYTVSDGRGGTDTATVSLAIAGVNDAPTLDLDTGTAGTGYLGAYVEDGVGIPVVDASVSIGDVDDTNIESATIILTNGQIGDVLEVGALPGGITAVVTPPVALTAAGTVTVTLTGSATLADYQAALQLVTYRSDSQTPSTLNRVVTLSVNDGDVDSATATALIVVTSVNDAPIAVDDGLFVPAEDTTRIFTPAELLGNDTDADGDTLVIQSVQGAVNGTVSINGGGNVVFTPTPDHFGPASFTYTVRDGSGATDTATVNLDITAVDDAPVIDLNGPAFGVDYAASYTENSAGIPVTSAAIDITDVDSANLTSASVTLTNGQVGDILEVGALPGGITASIVPPTALTASGPVTVTLTGPASLANFESALQLVTFRSTSENPDTTNRSLQIVVSDGTSNSASVTSTISVIEVNDAPLAADDGAFGTNEDTTLVLTSAALLGNDTDPEGDTLVLVSVQGAINGMVSINGAGDVEFVPTPDYAGPASFTYTISDGRGGVDTATAMINVLPINDAPVIDLNGPAAGADYSTIYTENGPALAIVDGAVTVFDVEGSDLVSATIVLTNGQIGDVVSIGTLPAGITGVVTPAVPLTAAGPVTVTLSGAATGVEYQTALQAIGFSSISDNPATTDRTVTVQVSEGPLDSNVATTQISIVRVNDAPIAVDDGVPAAIAALEDTPIVLTPLANDTDVDGDALTLTAVEGVAIAPGTSITVAGATYALAVDGVTLTYTPPADFNGLTSFVYTASDGTLQDDGEVFLNVAPVNDAPVAADDGPLVLAEDTTITFDPVTTNDVDVDGDLLTVTAIDGTPIAPGATVAVTNGSLTLAADGRTMTFAPALNFFGPAALTYTVSDGAETDDAVVTFDVTPVNDATIVTGAAADVTLNDSDTVNIPMAAFFADVDGDPLTFGGINMPAGLTIDPVTGVLAGVLDNSASSGSPYTVTITATDGLSPVVSFDFTITVVNIPPVAVSAPNVLLDDGDTFAFDANPLFLDADGDTLTFSGAGLPVWATINATTGFISGTVPSDASTMGPVTFTVTVDDGDGGSVSTNVTFDPRNVAPVGSPPDRAFPEETDVTIDIASLYMDGGSDMDPLTFAVTGLPPGLTFDPVTNTVSGTTELGSASSTPYVVTVTVDDGQGGVLVDTFQIRVGDFSYEEKEPVFPVRGPGREGVDLFGDNASVDGPLGRALNDLQDLNPTLGVESSDGIILSTVSEVEPLHGATSGTPGSGASAPNQIDALGELSNSTDWLTSSGRIGNGDWEIQLESNYLPLDFDTPVRDNDSWLEKIEVSVIRQKSALFIEVTNRFDPLVDGTVERVFMTDLDGKPLPGWIKMIRSGFLSVNPPADIGELDLRVVVKLSSGEEIAKTVQVNLKDAVAIETASPKEAATKDVPAQTPENAKDISPDLAERIRMDAV